MCTCRNARHRIILFSNTENPVEGLDASYRCAPSLWLETAPAMLRPHFMMMGCPARCASSRAACGLPQGDHPAARAASQGDGRHAALLPAGVVQARLQPAALLEPAAAGAQGPRRRGGRRGGGWRRQPADHHGHQHTDPGARRRGRQGGVVGAGACLEPHGRVAPRWNQCAEPAQVQKRVVDGGACASGCAVLRAGDFRRAAGEPAGARGPRAPPRAPSVPPPPPRRGSRWAATRTFCGGCSCWRCTCGGRCSRAAPPPRCGGASRTSAPSRARCALCWCSRRAAPMGTQPLSGAAGHVSRSQRFPLGSTQHPARHPHSPCARARSGGGRGGPQGGAVGSWATRSVPLVAPHVPSAGV